MKALFMIGAGVFMLVAVFIAAANGHPGWAAVLAVVAAIAAMDRYDKIR